MTANISDDVKAGRTQIDRNMRQLLYVKVSVKKPNPSYGIMIHAKPTNRLINNRSYKTSHRHKATWQN